MNDARRHGLSGSCRLLLRRSGPSVTNRPWLSPVSYRTPLRESRPLCRIWSRSLSSIAGLKPRRTGAILFVLTVGDGQASC